MFYVAEALLLALGPSYSKHAAVIAAFGREYAKTGVLDPKFHRLLLDAYRIRNVGDYEIGTPVPKEKAEESATGPPNSSELQKPTYQRRAAVSRIFARFIKTCRDQAKWSTHW